DLVCTLLGTCRDRRLCGNCACARVAGVCIACGGGRERSANDNAMVACAAKCGLAEQDPRSGLDRAGNLVALLLVGDLAWQALGRSGAVGSLVSGHLWFLRFGPVRVSSAGREVTRRPCLRAVPSDMRLSPKRRRR